MRVWLAGRADMLPWLHLALEVEPLFGAAMATDPEFHRILRRNMARGTAFCVRAGDGPAGSALLGALMVSPKPPVYSINWLVVAATARRQGIARALVARALGDVVGPASLKVTTFTADEPLGGPARAFYGSLGLAPAERIDSPYGPRQVLRCDLGPGPKPFRELGPD